MFFPPSFLDEIRDKIPVSQVVAGKVKLQKRGREYVGLSPFKVEKTPSFTVNDQKRFYHCFATGEHGDIFTFLMKTEGLSFKEAVERLAGQAGLQVPRSSPEAVKQAEKRSQLHEIMQESALFFKQSLQTAPARHARDYIQKRGLSAAQLDKFMIGYAPNGRDILKNHLKAKGFHEKDIITSGMLIGGPDIKTPYDRFRNRLMFPILDQKGRVIAFGGRALSDDQPAKYLNSPETPLFHKGRQLYNLNHARQKAYEQGTMIAAEGYMDVIALDGAGFEHAVAPLGTALTADQLGLMWRICAEPILCFDGDEAGKRAAFRAVETALPLLKPGRSIKFALLPGGQDPDDLIKVGGKEAMQQILQAAKPLSQILWQKEFLSGDWQTPEQRAALEKQLMNQVARIHDTSVQVHYRREMKDRLWRYFRRLNSITNQADDIKRGRFGGKRQRGGGRSFQHRVSASQQLVDSPLVRRANSSDGGTREVLITLCLVAHPWLIEQVDETLLRLKFDNEDCEKIIQGALEARIMQNPLDRQGLEAHLRHLELLDRVSALRDSLTHNGNSFIDTDADPIMVQQAFEALLARHLRMQTLKTELNVALHAFDKEATAANYERIAELNKEINQCL